MGDLTYYLRYWKDRKVSSFQMVNFIDEAEKLDRELEMTKNNLEAAESDIEKLKEFIEVLEKYNSVLNAELDKLKEQKPVEIEVPDYHYDGMGCGLEDRNITDRYEAMRHGWDCAIEKMFAQIPEDVYTHPLPAQQDELINNLSVWYGAMPESNGKENWTATLYNKNKDSFFGGIADGFTIARSEYPDRVRYEADRVRFLIGEIKERPFLLDYDSDKHSSYCDQSPAVAVTDLKMVIAKLNSAQRCHPNAVQFLIDEAIELLAAAPTPPSDEVLHE